MPHHAIMKPQSILAGSAVAAIPTLATIVLICALRTDPQIALGLCIMALVIVVRYIGRRFCQVALLGSLIFAADYLPPTGSLAIAASYQTMFVLFMGASLAICMDVKRLRHLFTTVGRGVSFPRPAHGRASRRAEESIVEQDAERKLVAHASALPRILFVDHTALLRGDEPALLNLILSLNRERYVPLVVLFADGPLALRLAEVGIESYILPLAPKVAPSRNHNRDDIGRLQIKAIISNMAQVGRLAQFIRQHHINIVHTNSLQADIIGGFAARLARVPVLWNAQDRSKTDYQSSPAASTFRWLCGWIPNYVVINSGATRETLNLKPNPPGAAIPGRTYSRSLRQFVQDGMQHTLAALADRSDQERVARVGMVGRLTPWQGQHVFLRAAALVRQRFPKTVFQIIGAATLDEQKYEAKLHALVATLDLSKNVELTGFRSDVPKLISDLDVLIHASTVAGPCGQVILEGMAAGKPVVATDGGGVSEIVVDGVTGFLVPIGDARAMAEAICRLLAAPEMAGQMGKRGFERACEHFAHEPAVRRTEQIYEQILQQCN
jgi:glycosyltransferase involved in cell wall biosynthesis